MEKTYTIRIKIGTENYPVVEDLSQDGVFEGSIFKDQYTQALSAINRYLEEKEKVSQDIYVGKNNIFSFLGDRGSGKTSCMRTIAGLLTGETKETAINNVSGGPYDKIKQTTFVPVDLIDPSYFDDKHNILEVILAKLYKNFRKRCEKCCHSERLSNQDQQTLAKSFAKTQNDLKYLVGDVEKQYSSVEKLQNLSAAVDLREDVHDLIRSYCKILGYGENAILVLEIDDVDLNTSQAGRMTEEIRKYFIQENVIVLMAMKFEQIDLVKRLDYVKEYKTLLEKNQMSYDEIDNMSERYLTKFLPLSQQIKMPQGFVLVSSKCIIISEDGKEELFDSISNCIVTIIKDTTGYVFRTETNNVSHIVPQNLRELGQLIRLLYKSERSKNRQSQDAFKSYLFGNWAMTNVDPIGRHIIEEIRNISNGSQCNARVVALLRQRYFYKSDVENEEINYILNKDNKTFNFSLGDVIALIDYVRNTRAEKETIKFLFLLQTLYTIKLHEHLVQLPSIKTVVSLQTNPDEAITDYHYIIGGRFFNTNLVKTIPEDKFRNSRAIRKLNISTINQFLEERNNDDRILPVYELIMLAVSRTIVSKSKDFDAIEPEFRTKYEARWLSEFHPNQQNVLFDINAILFNLTHVIQCYSRFDNNEQLFNEILQNKSSLFNAIKSYQAKMIERFSNIEDLLALSDYLSRQRYSTTEPAELLGEFFYHISLFFEKQFKDKNNIFSILYKTIKKWDEYQIKIFRLLFESAQLLDISFVLNGVSSKRPQNADYICRRIIMCCPSLEYSTIYKKWEEELRDNIIFDSQTKDRDFYRQWLEDLKQRLEMQE